LDLQVKGEPKLNGLVFNASPWSTTLPQHANQHIECQELTYTVGGQRAGN